MNYLDLSTFETYSEAIRSFDLLISGEVSIVTYYGFSGVGKTTLLEWLKTNKCETREIPYAWVKPFGTSTGKFGTEFMQKVIDHLDHLLVQNLAETFFEKRKEIILQLGEPPQLEQYIHTGKANLLALDTSWKQRTEIAWEELSRIFINCLKSIHKTDIVIFVDAFERIPIADERWLWTLFERLVSIVPSVKVVTATQRLSNRSPEKYIQVELSSLNRADSDRLIRSQGVDDPEFQQVVYEKLAQGHPQVTKFAIDTWAQAKAKGCTLDLENIPQVIEQENAIRWIYSKIIDYLDDSTKRVIPHIATLKWFNLETINEVTPHEAEALSRQDFENLIRFSFVERTADGEAWVFTKIFQRIVASSFSQREPEEFYGSHYRAYMFFWNKKNYPASLYHLFFIDQVKALEEWNRQRKAAKSEQNFDLVDVLFDIALAEEIELAAPDLAFVHMKKAHYLRQNSYLDAAKQEYEQALKHYQGVGLTQDHMHAQHGYAVLLALEGNYDEAKAKLEALLNWNENDIYSRNTLASIEASLGDFESARWHLEQSRNVLPNEPVTLKISAQIEINANNLPKAIQYLEKASEVLPDDTDTLQKLANSHLQLGQAYLKKARSASLKNEGQKDKLRTLLYEFLALADAGNLNEARSVFKTIRLLDSGLSDILERWARSEQTKKNYQKASVLYEIYLDYYPNNSNVLFSYGWLKFANRELELARKLFSKSLELDSGRAETWYFLGEVERAEKNSEAAAECYEQAYIAWDTNDSYDSKMGYKILSKWSKEEYRLDNFVKGAELYQRLHKLALPNSKCRVLVSWAVSEFEHENYTNGDHQLSRAIDCCQNLEKPCYVTTYLEQELSPRVGKTTSRSMKTARSIAAHSSHKVIGKIVLARLYRKSNMPEKAQSIINKLTSDFPNDSILRSEVERNWSVGDSHK